jgi:hypothetical protein
VPRIDLLSFLIKMLQRCPEAAEASPRVALGLMQRHGGSGVSADALALRCAPGFVAAIAAAAASF